MADGLVIDVGDLVGHLEARRSVSGSRHAKLRLGDAVVDGDIAISADVAGTLDGVIASFKATAPVHLVCARCLTEWDEDVNAEGSQHFGSIPDEDGYVISDDQIDVAAPAIDEISLSLPPTPLCRRDCLGLCPTCGTDLNNDPCDGHGEDSDSPFAALKDLFDS